MKKMTNFRKVGEHLLPLSVNRVRINPSMDIVAIELSSSDIIINRLFSWQRVWTITKPKIQSSGEKIKVIDMVWSNDGKLLAVAYNQHIIIEDNNKKKQNDDENNVNNKSKHCSSIVLYLIESTQKVCIHNIDYDITCLCWQVKSYLQDRESSTNNKSTSTIKAIDMNELKLPLDSIQIPYVDLFICDEDLLNYPFNNNNNNGRNRKSNETNRQMTNRMKFSTTTNQLPALNNGRDEFIGYDRMNLLNNNTINLLIIGTKQNAIIFYLQGYYQIQNINIEHSFDDDDDDHYHIDGIWMSPDLNLMQCYFKNSNNNNDDDDSRLMLFETKLFGNLWKEIFLVNRIRFNIDIRIESLNEIIKDIFCIWSDVVVDIKSRLSNYEFIDFISNKSDDDNKLNDKIEIKFKDFIDMLIFGNISLNVERFFHDLNRKETSKLYLSFEHCLDDINRLIITKLLNILTQSLSFVDNLRGMALNDLQFGDISISIRLVNELRREIIWMMDKCNVLMTMMNNLKLKILAITRMIYKGIIMSSQYSSFDNNNSDNNNCINIDYNEIGKMTIQDFHLIMALFNSNESSIMKNDFEFFRIERILDTNPSSSSTLSSIELINDDHDIVQQNLYKTYWQNKNLKQFYQSIINDDDDDEKQKCTVDELIRSMFECGDKSIENLPDDDDDNTKQWFKNLMNNYSNIDLFDDCCTANWSLMDHLKRLSTIKQQLFNESFDKMNRLQTKSMNQSSKTIHLNKFNDHHSMIDCLNALTIKQSSVVYIAQMSNKYRMSIFRIEQLLNQHIELLKFQLINNQSNIKIENFKFYDYDWITMIITELNDDDHQCNKQYLLQCKYSLMFHTFKKWSNGGYINQCIINDDQYNYDSIKIDIGSLINDNNDDERFMIINGNRFIVPNNPDNDDDDDQTSLNVDSFFKIRCLTTNNHDNNTCNQNQIQKLLSVSGNRNLVCCLDNDHCRMTTFEMDICEDFDDNDNGDDLS